MRATVNRLVVGAAVIATLGVACSSSDVGSSGGDKDSCSQGAQDVVPAVGVLSFVKDVFKVDGEIVRDALAESSPDADGHVSVRLPVTRSEHPDSTRLMLEEVLIPSDIMASISEDGRESEFLLGVAYSTLTESWQVEVGLAGAPGEYHWLGRCGSDLNAVTAALKSGPDYATDPTAAYVRLLTDADFRDGVVAEASGEQGASDLTFLDPDSDDPDLLEGLTLVPVRLEVPLAWVGQDRIICAKIDRGWNDCVSLEVFDPEDGTVTVLMYVQGDSPIEIWVNRLDTTQPLHLAGTAAASQVSEALADTALEIRIESDRPIKGSSDIDSAIRSGEVSVTLTGGQANP